MLPLRPVKLAEFRLCLPCKVIPVYQEQDPLRRRIIQHTIACQTSQVGLAAAGSKNRKIFLSAVLHGLLKLNLSIILTITQTTFFQSRKSTILRYLVDEGKHLLRRMHLRQFHVVPVRIRQHILEVNLLPVRHIDKRNQTLIPQAIPVLRTSCIILSLLFDLRSQRILFTFCLDNSYSLIIDK